MSNSYKWTYNYVVDFVIERIELKKKSCKMKLSSNYLFKITSVISASINI